MAWFNQSFGQAGVVDTVNPEEKRRISKRYEELAKTVAEGRKGMPAAQNWLGVLAHAISGGIEGYGKRKAEEERKQNAEVLMEDINSGNWGGVAEYDPKLGAEMAIKTNPAFDSNKTDQQRFLEFAAKKEKMENPNLSDAEAMARAYDKFTVFSRGIKPMVIDNTIVGAQNYQLPFGSAAAPEPQQPNRGGVPSPLPTDPVSSIPAPEPPPLDPAILDDKFNTAANMVDNTPPGERISPVDKIQKLASAISSPSGQANVIYRGEDPASMEGRKSTASEAGKQSQQTWFKDYDTVKTQTSSLEDYISSLPVLASLAQKAKSGTGRESINSMIKLGNQIFPGMFSEESMKTAQAGDVFDALTNRATLQMLGGRLGAGMSDADRTFTKSIAGSLSVNPRAFEILQITYPAMARRSREIQEIYEANMQSNDGRITSDVNKQVKELKNKPLYTQEEMDSINSMFGSGAAMSPNKKSDMKKKYNLQ